MSTVAEAWSVTYWAPHRLAEVGRRVECFGVRTQPNDFEPPAW